MGAFKAVLVVMLATAACADRYHPDNEDNYGRTEGAKTNINAAEQSADHWKNEAMTGIDKRIKEITNNKVARNVILFLGDGMSVPTLMAARTLKGQRDYNKTGEETRLFFENFPTVGLTKTYCVNYQIPDSACTATAYLTGIKNNYGTIGVTGAVPRRDCLASMNKSTHLDSIAVWALEDGRDAGIVTTTRITHASPAGTYARVANRNWENDAEVVRAGYSTDQCPDITHQLVHTFPGNQFKVILGGGRRNFIPTTQIDEEGATGRRTDNRNLIQEWQALKQTQNASYKYVWNRSELLSLRTSPPEYLLGLFESSHMKYHTQANKMTEPTLKELTEVAINSLSRNKKGYFLFVEGGRIDHAHHSSWPEIALDETIELDKAIEKAVVMTGDDTLIVVAADHAHVMTINGYSKRGRDILGISNDRDKDNIPYMTLFYTNGPGARKHVNGTRPDVTQEKKFRDTIKQGWRAHADVPLDSETHGGEDVAVLAYGPHHHMFSGLYEQSQIPWRMAYAACIGPGSHSGYCNSAALHYPSLSFISFFFFFVCRINQQ